MRRRFLVTAATLGLIAVAPSMRADSSPRQSFRREAGAAPAPSLDLTDLRGRQHTLAEYAGRVLVVNFWATWCPPCRKEIPSLNRAAHALRAEPVAFVAVNIGESAEAVAAFVERYPIDFPVLLDPMQEAVGRWPVVGLPTTVVVSPDGAVAYRIAGDRAWDGADALSAIRSLAGSGSGVTTR